MSRRCTTHSHACDCREERFAKIEAALRKAVAEYGRPGGPWNVPNEPGTWIAMARESLDGDTSEVPG